MPVVPETGRSQLDPCRRRSPSYGRSFPSNEAVPVRQHDVFPATGRSPRVGIARMTGSYDARDSPGIGRMTGSYDAGDSPGIARVAGSYDGGDRPHGGKAHPLERAMPAIPNHGLRRIVIPSQARADRHHLITRRRSPARRAPTGAGDRAWDRPRGGRAVFVGVCGPAIKKTGASDEAPVKVRDDGSGSGGWNRERLFHTGVARIARLETGDLHNSRVVRLRVLPSGTRATARVRRRHLRVRR